MKTICYLSFGYPSIAHSLDMAALYLKAGCDMIECSIPAKNPYLDPEYVADRMADALCACGEYNEYLAHLGGFLQEHPDASVALLMYEETIKEIGIEKLLAFCEQHSIRDLIYAGLRDASLRQQLIDGGVRICSPVMRLMKEEDIQAALESNGFIYMEAKSQNIHAGYDTLEKCIARLREVGIDRPIYCGVGVHSPEDVRMVRAAGGDGYFIGSTLIRLYDRPDELVGTIEIFKAASIT